MARKREDILEDNDKNIKVVDQQKKKTPIALIITVSVIAALAIIISSALPFIFIFGAALFQDNIEFKNEDNKVYIDKYKATIENINNYYDEENECYVMQFKYDRDGEVNKNSSIFAGYENYLEIIYTLKDKDGYIIGEEYLSIDDYDKFDKIKKSIYYCDDNALDVYSIEATKVTKY